MKEDREDKPAGGEPENGRLRRMNAAERRERSAAHQAEMTRREIAKFHSRDFVYIGLLCALILIAVLILMSMRSLRGGNNVKVIVPPTAAATSATETTASYTAAATASYYSGSVGELVNINTATLEELKALPGIGDKRAADIIEYRNTYGAFPNTHDITEVPGIGESIFEQLKDRITV